MRLYYSTPLLNLLFYQCEHLPIQFLLDNGCFNPIACQLRREGYYIDPDDLSALSPYLTEHIKRFGDYVIDLQEPPQRL
ncbi:Tn3 family transposase [Thermoactinomyces sp. CICC 10523]|nr:Tn3 family transposase [Thermoactinomyces sp. CICC 10523]